MNIIKFIDTVVDNKEWYNNNIRGKYAYWIHCTYVVTFDDMMDGYMSMEKFNNDEIVDYLESNEIQYLDLEGRDSWAKNYIDWTITEKVNDISKFIKSNSFIPDDDITIDDLKNFRTWLAQTLLNNLSLDKDSVEERVLNYYSSCMYDDVIKGLNQLGGTSISINTIKSSSCGCGGSSNVSSLYGDSVSVCDPISIYTSNIKNSMISMFSNLDTWRELNDINEDIIGEIIKYLNGILKNNLPLVNTNNVLDIYSCRCLSDVNNAQIQAQKMVQDVIDVLTWIKDGEPTDANMSKTNASLFLSSWALNLYENMQWRDCKS